MLSELSHLLQLQVLLWNDLWYETTASLVAWASQRMQERLLKEY